MSVTKIKEKIIYTLWGRAGGICEICGEPLAIDPLTKKLKHRGYVAHIYGEKEGAARYNRVLSKRYCDDIDYLMLLCNSCHKRIDVDEPLNYSVEKLCSLKKEHEDLIARIVACKRYKKSQALTLRAKIGEHIPDRFDNNLLIESIINNHKQPKTNTPISLLDVCDLDDSQTAYWEFSKQSLITKFKQIVDTHSDISAWSIFAIAPQPLLILLGSLLTELHDVDIYQKHRINNTWTWPIDNNDKVKFKVLKPANTNLDNIAIKFSLSADISDNRITEVLGESTSIWEIKIDSPNVNFVKNSAIQTDFKDVFGTVLNDINRIRPDKKEIKLFPAVPQSLAVCIGQKRMPKADKIFVIYDQNNKEGYFIKTITID